MTSIVRIEGLFAGRAEELWPDKPPSAIRKVPVEAPVEIGAHGLIGDAQADLNVHGGPEKALHHYPAEHYPTWCAELDRSDLVPGGFGENISTKGMTETSVCIGDIFTLGSATVQISQGRQPCWKLNAHTGDDRMAWRFQKSGRTGWYYRVLSPGKVQPGDTLMLVDRPHPDWTVKSVTIARLSRKVTPEDAAVLADMSELAEGWRLAFARMAQGDLREDVRGRLQLPS